MLIPDILFIILELLAKDSKDLLRFLATCRKMQGVTRELSAANPKRLSRLVFLTEVNRLSQRHDEMRKRLKRDLGTHRRRGEQLGRLRTQALGLDPSSVGKVSAAQRSLVAALVSTRKLVGKLAKAARAEVQGSIAVYRHIGTYLTHFKAHLDAGDRALFDAVERAYESNSSKSKLAKKYADFDACILKPYNACVDLCNLMQLPGVPKKILAW